MEQILTTTDYSIFTRLKGNRPVNEAHVMKIVDSIRKRGVIDTVIYCTSDMQVLEGQHRLEAFKRLGLPVKYKVSAGASIDDCISMNAAQQSWSIEDYIGSFAERGFPAYLKLQELAVKYPDMTTNVFLHVLGNYQPRRKKLSKMQESVRIGELHYPFEQEEQLIAELDYLAQFSFFKNYKRRGRNDIFYKAISACYRCSLIDNNRLLERLSSDGARMAAYNTFKECLDGIEAVYNARKRGHVYLTTEVLKALRDKE